MAGDEEVEAVRDVIIESTDCVPNGGEGFVGWSQVLAERIVETLDRVRSRPVDGTEGEDHEAGIEAERCTCGHEESDGRADVLRCSVHGIAARSSGSAAPCPVSGTELDTAKLVEALRNFGVHSEMCPRHQMFAECTCGLDDALAGFSVDAGKTEEER